MFDFFILTKDANCYIIIKQEEVLIIFLNKIKKLFITTEEAEKRLSELEFIIKEMYPDLPNVSAEEYLNLKNKFFEGDLQARQKLELFAFKSSISSLNTFT